MVESRVERTIRKKEIRVLKIERVTERGRWTRKRRRGSDWGDDSRPRVEEGSRPLGLRFLLLL